MERLSDHFAGVATKRLTSVEVDPRSSNQSELQGVQNLRVMLGEHYRQIDSVCLYLADDESERVTHRGNLTWYDSREHDPTRNAEFRLYYPSRNEAIRAAAPDDTLIYALGHDQRLVLVIVPQGSELEPELFTLFGITRTPTRALQVEFNLDREVSTSLFSYISSETGIGFEAKAESHHDWATPILSQYGGQFPSTQQLSDIAFETLCQTSDLVHQPDQALVALADREEVIFNQIERALVSDHIATHAHSWSQDVDAFIQFAHSVLNRRKSRAGKSLELHLRRIFDANRIRYAHGAITETHSRPDFLFPDVWTYQTSSYGHPDLEMLGVKTTCKDRWRQVLQEAHKVPHKHLLTLQPQFSANQLEQMRGASLTLVIPMLWQSAIDDAMAVSLERFLNHLKYKHGQLL